MRKLPNKYFRWAWALWLALGVVVISPTSWAVASTSPQAEKEASPEAIIQQFVGEEETSSVIRIDTKRKHQILFLMGLALLVLILLTGALGVAMVLFDKDVFVLHMICAGLSITLALVHAATSIAWFWPY